MEYLTTEWLIEWARTHCMSDEELDFKNKTALEEANIVMGKIKETEITVEPITFKASSFTSARAFSKTMLLAAEYFKGNNSIVVRYSKPENKESGEVTVCFQILKSKAKMFLKHLVETKEKLTFTLSSNKDIKSCIKSLNSLGVKGDKGEPLSSKNTDYGSNIKDSIGDSGRVVCITVEYDDEYGCPILGWDLIEDSGNIEPYSVVKERIDEIIKTV